MNKQDSLSKQELEELAQQYLDCQLSLLQEKELEYVLSCVDISTPILDEAREIMGISTLITAGQPKSVVTKKRHGWRTTLKWSGIAACLALAVLTGFKFLSSSTTDAADSQYYVLIYIDGEEISSKEEAKRIAEEDYARNMALLADMRAEANADIKESMEMIREVQQ